MEKTETTEILRSEVAEPKLKPFCGAGAKPEQFCLRFDALIKIRIFDNIITPLKGVACLFPLIKPGRGIKREINRYQTKPKQL